MSRSTTLAPQPGLYRAAVKSAFAKLDPRQLMGNPVIFVTALVAAMTTVLVLRDLVTGAPVGFGLQVTLWLCWPCWFPPLLRLWPKAVAGRGQTVCGQPKPKPWCDFWPRNPPRT